MHAVLLQLDELDITASCAGWQLDGVGNAAAGSELVLRFGPLLRLRLFVSAAAAGAKRPNVRGYLEHTQPGASSDSCRVAPARVLQAQWHQPVLQSVLLLT